MKGLRRGRGNVYGASEYEVLNVPRCRLRHSVAQTLTTAVGFLMLFDTIDYDSDGMHSTTNFTSAIVCRTAGVYLLVAQCFFDVGAGGTYRLVQLRLNGVTILASANGAPHGALDGAGINAVTHYALNRGDYVEVIATQNSGGNLNVLSVVSQTPVFSATLVSTI